MTPENRKRVGLVVIVLLFAAPITTAYVLNALGWRPPPTKNFGTLVEPARDLSGVVLTRADGTPLPLRSDPVWQWTLLGLPSKACASNCRARIDELRRARLTLNQNAEHVRVVVVDDALPDTALADQQPVELARDPGGALATLRPDGEDRFVAALVDPHGFLILTYAPGYDGNGLRKDMARLFK